MLLFLLASSLSFAAPEVSAQRNPDANTEPVETTTLDEGQFVIDAKIATEVLIDGRKIAQVWAPAKLIFRAVPGKHVVRVYVNGSPEDVDVEIMPTGETIMIVGRTGITTGQPGQVAEPMGDGIAQVSFRAAGVVATQVRIGRERFTVEPNTVHSMDLAAGKHQISVRSEDGTAIWATGYIVLDGGNVVIQVTEGRMPEVTGDGRFISRSN